MKKTKSLITDSVALIAAALVTWYLWIPAVYVLALSVIREIFPWFVWYKQYERATAVILNKELWKPLPFLFLLTFFVVRWLVRKILKVKRETEKRPPRAWRVARALILIAVLGASGAYFLAGLAANAVYQVRTFPPTGMTLQRQKCSLCHPAYRPFHYMKEPEQWRLTVERMRRVNEAPIDEAQEEKIIAYLMRRNTYSDAWLFRAKCGRCHGLDEITQQQRTAEEWRLIARRLQRLSVYAFRDEWLRQIGNHTDKQLATQPPDGEARKKKVQFEQRCGACHALHLVRREEAVAAGADELIARMTTKVPGSFTVAEQETIAGYLVELPAAEAEFKSLFPHDYPVEAAW